MTEKEYKKWNKKYNREFNDIFCIGMGIPYFSKDYPAEFLQIKRKEQEELCSNYLKFLEQLSDKRDK